MKEDEDTRVVIPRDILTKKTDSRGRITLGSEYADEEVTVAVIEVSE
jgi:hypothetical protein